MYFALILALQIQDPLGGARAHWAGAGPPGLDQGPLGSLCACSSAMQGNIRGDPACRRSWVSMRHGYMTFRQRDNLTRAQFPHL